MTRSNVFLNVLLFSLSLLGRPAAGGGISNDLSATNEPPTAFLNNATSTTPIRLGSNELTLSGVFSTFLALWLCGLTQPYGSLLFIRKGGIYWRLSPISCIFEALLIVHSLLLEPDRMRPSQERSSSSKTTQKYLGSGWRVTAAALLLVRSGKYPPQHALQLDEIKHDLAKEHNWRL
jgi:hypothetical protein